MTDLIEGSFDLALRNSALEDSSLKGRKLADDKRVLCASPSYVAQHGAPRCPDELAEHRLIAFKDQSAKPLIGRDGHAGQFDPGGRPDAGSSWTMGSAKSWRRSRAPAFRKNSLWSVHRELIDGRLIRVLSGYEIDDQSVLWLVYPKSNVLTVKVRTFIDFLLNKIGKSPVWLEA